MLVLTRKPGEIINISDNITITIVRVQGNQVKLGIDAPKGVDVHRNEIYQAIQQGQTLEEYLNQKETVKRNSRANKVAAIKPPTVTIKKGKISG